MPSPQRTRRSQAPSALLSAAPVVTASAGDVGARILSWVLETTQDAAVWLVKGGYRALAEGGSLLLIVSGLSILAIVVPVMLLQGAVAEKTNTTADHGEEPSERRLHKPPRGSAAAAAATMHDPADIEHDASALARGYRSAEELDGLTLVDDALDALVAEGLGRPWVLHLAEHVTVVRIHDCAGCREPAPNADGCAFETGFLQGAFQQLYPEADVVVREVACHGIGHTSCEYEVHH